MRLLHDVILQHVPHKHRVTQQGWIWFNAPCCHHRGHKADTRMRGNLKLSTDHTAGYHCFNCGCKWRFTGSSVSDTLQDWLIWLGVDTEQISQIKLDLLQHKMSGDSSDLSDHAVHVTPKKIRVDLPEQAVSMHVLQAHDFHHAQFDQACAYVKSRGRYVSEHFDFYWSESERHDLQNRIILPFWDADQIVGWSARWCGTPSPGKPKYWNSQIPAGYLFNQNVLHKPRQFQLVCEGPFDAIACDGVAVMGSHMSEYQIHTLLQSDTQPIILPDRTARNQDLIDQALTFGWAVSFPEWDADVKDAADACNKYGVIYTITSALQARTANPLEIGIKRKMFRG